MGTRSKEPMFPVCTCLCQCGEYAMVVGERVLCEAEMYLEYEEGNENGEQGRRGGRS